MNNSKITNTYLKKFTKEEKNKKEVKKELEKDESEIAKVEKKYW